MPYCTDPISSKSRRRNFSSFLSARIVLSLKEPVEVKFDDYYPFGKSQLFSNGTINSR